MGAGLHALAAAGAVPLDDAAFALARAGNGLELAGFLAVAAAGAVGIVDHRVAAHVVVGHDGAGGTGVHALHAAAALVKVDVRQAVHQPQGAELAGALALAAADAAGCAGLPHHLAAQMRRAGAVYGVAGGHQLQHAARAGGEADAAADALFLVHRRQTALDHVDGPEGTGGLAIAKAEAAVFAGLVAAGHQRRALAVPGAVVVKAQFAAVEAAAAAYRGDALFPLSGLHAHDLGDLLRHGVAAHGALVHRGIAAGHLFGVGVAAGKAAAAAVGPGQAFAHRRLFRVFLDAEDAADDGQQGAKDQPHAADHQGGGQDRTKIHFLPPPLKSGPRSPRRPRPSAPRR